ncbi:O-antigen ligase family protein [Guyparkeria hydrothermalis]|uniref:O-antigen ligase family protein n=1 Tax=Guyparkeria hydrothermalis TaxID=923 RepID=UPI002020CFB3|nr:O-antigen ligase [Guyparkeria hydrothermalis]MCL7750724.1 O-antigen ligase family protein [Guyparkeria hydrothermalis]
MARLFIMHILNIVLLCLLAFVGGIFYHGPSDALWLPVVGIPLVFIMVMLLTDQPAQAWKTSPMVVKWVGLCLTGFLAWGLGSALLGGWPAVSYWYWLTFAWLLTSFGLMERLPERHRDLVLSASLGIVVLTAVAAIVDYAWFSPRASGPFIDPNSFAALINVAIFVALSEYLRRSLSGLKTRLIWMAVAILALTLILTQSRGAWLAFVGGACLYLFVTWRFWHILPRPAVLKGPAAVGLGFILGAGALGVSFFDRAESVVTSDQTARLLIWDSTLQAIDEHGWVGTGLGTFKLYYPEFRYLEETGTAGDMAHNDYLQLALETGLPGAMMFASVVVLVFLTFLRRGVFARKMQKPREAISRLSGSVMLIAVLTAFAHALVNFVFYEAAITILIGIALSVGLRRLYSGKFHDVDAFRAVDGPRRKASALPWLFAGLLSFGLVCDALIATFLALESPHVEQPGGVDSDRYRMAQLVSTLYPLNTKATEYAMAAEFNEAANMPIPPIKEMAEKLAVDNAKRLLRYKERDCMAQTVVAEFPTRVAQRNGVTDPETYSEAIGSLRVANRQLPLCMPAYLELSDLLVLVDQKADALDVLLDATKVFAIRDEDQPNRLEVLERAGQLAEELGEAQVALRMAVSLIENEARSEWALEFLEEHGELRRPVTQ